MRCQDREMCNGHVPEGCRRARMLSKSQPVLKRKLISEAKIKLKCQARRSMSVGVADHLVGFSEALEKVPRLFLRTKRSLQS